MSEPGKTCLTCGKALKGRSDKKFCDDYCRNAYNNRLKAEDNNYVRKIINNLRKNRRILEELLPAHEKMSKASRDKLLQMGFQFKYFTHTYANRKGDIYYFCFDHGYLPLEQGWYLLVRKKEI
jgi:predicted nucleic acid-binding Zn ribbon protein